MLLNPIGHQKICNRFKLSFLVCNFIYRQSLVIIQFEIINRNNVL